MNKQTKTIKERVLLRIRRSKKEVFLRSDFASLSDYDQVGRALKQLRLAKGSTPAPALA